MSGLVSKTVILESKSGNKVSLCDRLDPNEIKTKNTLNEQRTIDWVHLSSVFNNIIKIMSKGLMSSVKSEK